MIVPRWFDQLDLLLGVVLGIPLGWLLVVFLVWLDQQVRRRR